MSNGLPSSLQPSLSPAFDRARDISRVLAVLFAIGFWIRLAMLAAAPVLVLINLPYPGNLHLFNLATDLTGFSTNQRLGTIAAFMLGLVPGLFLLHHGRRLFGHFARGEVFDAASVAQIRAVGLWLVIATFASPAAQAALDLIRGAQPEFPLRVMDLIFGAATVIAAFVMAEAQRIGDENASIL